ncbi:unnamed protein product [Anisakis simplex]|uniref:ZP domain-containing protein n=1 Tax=Anisakis simplex TaxID=6269 RepID=A0A0M3JY42_ANISI|nr:unnamed protein product [Anisakis simplex]
MMILRLLPFSLPLIFACAPPGFVPSQDPSCYMKFSSANMNLKAGLRVQFTLLIAFVNARCSDLILYPVSAVDQSDQYRFDYSDVSFGNTHSQGATVAITCTTGGQPATVEGYDQVSET